MTFLLHHYESSLPTTLPNNPPDLTVPPHGPCTSIGVNEVAGNISSHPCTPLPESLNVTRPPSHQVPVFRTTRTSTGLLTVEVSLRPRSRPLKTPTVGTRPSTQTRKGDLSLTIERGRQRENEKGGWTV